MCPQLALYALNPRFSGRTSRICVKTVQAQSILGAAFFCVTCVLRFVEDFFGVCFVNVSIEMLYTLLFPLFLGPVFLICSKTCVVFFYSIFDRGISQNGSCYLLLVYILTLSGSSFRKRSNVIGEEGCLSSFEEDVDGPGEPVNVFGVHCYCWKLLQPQDG